MLLELLLSELGHSSSRSASHDTFFSSIILCSFNEGPVLSCSSILPFVAAKLRESFLPTVGGNFLASPPLPSPTPRITFRCITLARRTWCGLRTTSLPFCGKPLVTSLCVCTPRALPECTRRLTWASPAPCCLPRCPWICCTVSGQYNDYLASYRPLCGDTPYPWCPNSSRVWFPTVVFADSASITPIFEGKQCLKISNSKSLWRNTSLKLNCTYLCGSHMVGEVLIVCPMSKENDNLSFRI